jgi:uncharacterized protein YndB with AHSA1/START domain
VTTANSGRLTIVLQGDREIVMTRVFDAPRERVFDAFTKPELLQRWYGARDWTLPVCEIDLRPGGSYHWVMRGPDGTEVHQRGTYQEVSPPERLVTSEQFDGFSEVGYRPEDATVNTMVLTERDGKTTWTATVRYPSQEARDGALQTPMEAGMNEGFARLDEALAAMS